MFIFKYIKRFYNFFKFIYNSCYNEYVWFFLRKEKKIFYFILYYIIKIFFFLLVLLLLSFWCYFIFYLLIYQFFNFFISFDSFNELVLFIFDKLLYSGYIIFIFFIEVHIIVIFFRLFLNLIYYIYYWLGLKKYKIIKDIIFIINGLNNFIVSFFRDIIDIFSCIISTGIELCFIKRMESNFTSFFNFFFRILFFNIIRFFFMFNKKIIIYYFFSIELFNFLEVMSLWFRISILYFILTTIFVKYSYIIFIVYVYFYYLWNYLKDNNQFITSFRNLDHCDLYNFFVTICNYRLEEFRYGVLLFFNLIKKKKKIFLNGYGRSDWDSIEDGFGFFNFIKKITSFMTYICNFFLCDIIYYFENYYERFKINPQSRINLDKKSSKKVIKRFYTKFGNITKFNVNRPKSFSKEKMKLKKSLKLKKNLKVKKFLKSTNFKKKFKLVDLKINNKILNNELVDCLNNYQNHPGLKYGVINDYLFILTSSDFIRSEKFGEQPTIKVSDNIKLDGTKGVQKIVSSVLNIKEPLKKGDITLFPSTKYEKTKVKCLNNISKKFNNKNFLKKEVKLLNINSDNKVDFDSVKIKNIQKTVIASAAVSLLDKKYGIINKKTKSLKKKNIIKKKSFLKKTDSLEKNNEKIINSYDKFNN